MGLIDNLLGSISDAVGGGVSDVMNTFSGGIGGVIFEGLLEFFIIGAAPLLAFTWLLGLGLWIAKASLFMLIVAEALIMGLSTVGGGNPMGRFISMNGTLISAVLNIIHSIVLIFIRLTHMLVQLIRG